MVSSPHRLVLVSSIKGGEQILSSGDRGEALVSPPDPQLLPVADPSPWPPSGWDAPSPAMTTHTPTIPTAYS